MIGNSPQLKHLDFMYASLGDGLYWACESQGAVDKIVSDRRGCNFARRAAGQHARLDARAINSNSPRRNRLNA